MTQGEFYLSGTDAAKTPARRQARCDMSKRIGIDLGGTKTEIAVLDGSTCLLRRRIPTPREEYTAILAAVSALVAEVERELGTQCTVGVAIPGAISPVSGLIKNANTVCLNGRPLHRDLTHALGREVRVANDANCMLVSEVSDGAAAGVGNAFGVIIGTGTGGAVVVEGRLVSGAQAIAGEWGHNPMPGIAGEHAGRACYCGRTDCIETWLSGAGLLRTFRDAGGAALVRVEALVEAAQHGDARARQVLDAYPGQLARALGTVINVLDPQCVVLAGGLSNLDGLCAAVMRELPAYVFSDVVQTRIVRAAHGDSSGVRGAAWLWPAA